MILYYSLFKFESISVLIPKFLYLSSEISEKNMIFFVIFGFSFS